MPWWTVTFLSRLGSASHYILSTFCVLETSPTVPSIWSAGFFFFFPGITSSGSSSFSSQPLLFIYINKFFTKFIWAVYLVFLKWWQCWHFCYQLFFYYSFMFDTNFSSSVVTFHLSAALSSLLANSLFQLSIFPNGTWVCHWETRKQPNCKLCCLCMNWIIGGWWPRTDSERLVTSSWCPSVIYVVQTVSRKDWIYAITHS